MEKAAAASVVQAGLEAVRQKARTDLYFLAKDILSYDLVEGVHRPVCTFFVAKDPTRPIDEQDAVKQRLLLDPRGHFKTTLDIADIIQWILCFPNIRILVMTGTLDLAKRMVQEVKSHFQYNETFRSLFPEFVPTKGVDDWGSSDSFTVPTRTLFKLREPTLSVATIESVKAGSHYDVIKMDDVVTEVNVGTRDQLAKVIQCFQYTTPILEPNGYRDVIGTRYTFDDLYGHILDGDTTGWKIHVRPAWTVKEQPDGSKEYTLLFPERFSYEQLKSFQAENPYLFNCQYLNRPIPGDQQHFTDAMLTSHFLPWTQLPKQLRVFVAWDIGYSQKEHADWSVGAVGGFDDKGRLFVLEILRGRWLPNQLVDMIIHSFLRYKPLAIGIEESVGTSMLGYALQMRGHDLKRYVPVQWLKVKNVKGAKQARINALEALLKQDRLYFSNTLDHKEDLLNEFLRFPIYSHDDIPDAIALLHENFAQSVDIAWPDDRVETSGWFGGAPELGGLIG